MVKTVKSLSHKYDEDTEYHHVAYHTLLRRFMLFCQGESINLELKEYFKEHIWVLETYNGGVIFGKSPGARAREIALLGLNVEITNEVEKA